MAAPAGSWSRRQRHHAEASRRTDRSSIEEQEAEEVDSDGDVACLDNGAPPTIVAGKAWRDNRVKLDLFHVCTFVWRINFDVTRRLRRDAVDAVAAGLPTLPEGIVDGARGVSALHGAAS